VLLIEALNTFNPLNGLLMLLTILKLWPHCCHFILNIYSEWPVLVLHGYSDFLYGKKVVTQGDTLAMLVHAIKTLPLILSLRM